MRPSPYVLRALLTIVFIALCFVRVSEAEWQLKPFIGATYGGDTSFVLVTESTGHSHLNFGGNVTFLSEIFGLEGDFGHTLNFFQGPEAPLVVDSGVTTLTGNIVVALPRHLAQYTLRPYLVGGAGLMHIAADDLQGALPISSTLKAMDLGAGVTGFLTKHLGVTWDVRYFRSIDRTIENGQSVGPEHLSFWRANMALAIRL